MPDFADDPTTELERKARALSWVALVETCTYLALLYFWLSGNDVGTALVGSVHGMVWLAFCAMTIMIAPAMRWTWRYVAIAIVTGPIGALMVWERIRRHGVPDPSPAS